jgi:EAL domain-containing protein (putative c-di-GMP-specific phosphodiesterase class I)
MRIDELRFAVVEDHQFQRWLATNLLRELGAVSVLPAEDGNAALRLLTASDTPIDIVVCDLQMPGMDGMELIRHMGQLRHPASLIVVSSMDDAILSSVETMAQEYGVSLLGVVQKPLSARKLRGLVERHRGGRAADAPAALQFPEERIAAALRLGELEVFYQPKVSMTTRELEGAEALVRWRHPQLGLVKPASFMAGVESCALIDEVTERVAREAALACRGWQEAGLSAGVSVNLSPACLFDTTLADRLTAIAAESGLPPRHMTFEVTETSAARDLARKLENLSRLRMKGFGLSIDDFGTGYSSMERLSRIPFTELKIDQAIVKTAATHPASRAVVEASLALARKLGIPAVAEGVESHVEWELLLAMGCPVAQGYHVAGAMPEAEFRAWAANAAARSARSDRSG